MAAMNESITTQTAAVAEEMEEKEKKVREIGRCLAGIPRSSLSLSLPSLSGSASALDHNNRADNADNTDNDEEKEEEELVVDLWHLRSLALSPGGLLNPHLRRRSWPKLLG